MISYDQLDFNPRSREGSDDVLSSNDFIFHDFNPRSREGSDYYSENPASDGTTFQSTLPRGERRNSNPVITSRHNFNPRSREGSDDEYLKEIGGVKRISIHAPARGATAGERVKLLLAMHFNPRSREGSDRFQHS